MKRRCRPFLPSLAALALLLPAGSARGADPTIAECLAASDASLRSGNEHRLRAERSQLVICAAVSCPAEVRRECIRRVDEVNLAMPSIIFEARDPAGNDLTAVRVTADGEILADRLDGLAISLDPGPHNFTFETAGQFAVQKRFIIREGQKERRELIVLGPPGLPPRRAPWQPSPLSLPAVEGHSGSGVQKGFAITALVVGVAALGTGGVLGAVAWSKRDNAHSECPSAVCDSQSGANAWKDAKTWGNASTIAFIIGGAGAGAATLLWLTDRSESVPAPSVQLSLGPGTLDVSGQW